MLSKNNTQFSTPSTGNRPSFMSYFVYLIVVLFLVYEMALQVSPSIITHQLMRDIHIEASLLGIISGVYFYSYMFMQIPSGLLFDRLKTRWLISIAILICVLGTVFFASSQTVWEAALGRFLMGIGSASAFISVLVVSSRWFPVSYFALLVGIAQLLAAAGALGGEAPLAIFTTALGWRAALYWLAVIGAVLALAVWLVLKNEPTPITHSSYTQPRISQSLKIVLSSSQTWWIALYAFCGWGPVATFASLWGVPYLMSLYHISNTMAAVACSMIWIGLMLGSPFFGWLSSYLGQRRIFLRACSLLGLMVSLVILYVPGVPFGLMLILLLGFGIATSGHILTFALAKEIHSPQVTATVIGFNNMAVVAGGAIFQPLVGVVLHFCWQGEMLNSVPFYTVSNYQTALFIVPLCYLVGWIVSQFFIRETHF